MATYSHLQSRLFARTYFDDDATAATARYIAWQLMGEYFLAICTFGAGTGVLTFKIFVATDSSGTNATVVKSHATPTTADAANDQLVLEVSAEECLEALRDAAVDTEAATQLYVSVEMDNDDNADENAITYIISGRRYPTSNMTADIIA